MPDHKRLGALALAQCGSFAAVLLLAAFSGPGHPPSPPVSSPSPVKSSQPASPSRPASPSPPASADVTFTVTASPAPAQPATSATPKPTPTGTHKASAVSFKNSQVVTLDAGTLKPVASDRLDSDDLALETVPANHSYLVCLRPPEGWKSAGGGTYGLPGWVCAGRHVGLTGENVSFTLQHAPSSSGAGSTG